MAKFRPQHEEVNIVDKLGDSLRAGLGVRGSGKEIDPIVLAETLFPWPWVDYQKEILLKLLEPDWTRMILLAPPRHRKPLHVTTRVLMPDGSEKLLKDVKVGDVILSGKGNPTTVTAVHEQGVLPLLLIKTESGEHVFSAFDHPFLVKRAGKLIWVNAEDILVGVDTLVSFDRSTPLSNRVSSVLLTGEGECRCLSVSRDSSFVANGFVVHNTTILSLFIAIFVGRDPNRRVMVASHTKDFAALLVNSVVKIMESPIYKRSYGDLLPKSGDDERWTTYEKHLPGRDAFVRDPTFLCLSPDSGTPGYGADAIILDDIVTQANSSSPTMRKHISHWVHGSLLKRLEPDGKFLVSGNRFYVDDFYGEILNDPGKKHWTRLIYPASPEKPLWPERWGEKELRQQMLDDPIFFHGQYLLKPLDLSAAGTFDPDWFQFYTSLPERLIPFAGVDLPITNRPGTSKYAEVVVGRDAHGVIYVLDGYSAYHNGRELPELMDKLQNTWNPVEVAWESNGPQRVVMEMTSRLVKSPIRFRGIPSEISKERRLASIAGKVRTGQILIPGKVNDDGRIIPIGIGKLIAEAWKSFPAGDLDLLDAFEKAVTLALQSPPPAAASISKYDSQGLREREEMMKSKRRKRPQQHRNRFSGKSYSRVFR